MVNPKDAHALLELLMTVVAVSIGAALAYYMIMLVYYWASGVYNRFFGD